MANQIWVIQVRGFMVSAYSTRDKAYAAAVKLEERGIIRANTYIIRAVELDKIPN